ncbi:hypothetical protein GCM10029992_50610 [Glycomyces albus]
MRSRIRRRLAALAAAAAFALAAAFLIAPQAQAAVDTDTWYTIESRHSGLVMDIAGASTEPGADLTQYTGNGGANQQFRFIDAGGGYYRIQARHSGLVLDVSGRSSANGADIIQWNDQGATNQQWQVTENSDGYHSIVSRSSGKALDVWEQSTEPGARVSQYTPTGSANQQWRLVPVDGDPSDPDDPYGYLFAYMLGEELQRRAGVLRAEPRQQSARLRLAQQRPARRHLHGGERGARDPFIVRHPDTGRYYMIATDLRIYGDGDWNRASRYGSRSLVVWESSDLVNWTSSRLEQVSPPAAGNTWAPEAYWDPSQNAFVVYWASKLYSTPDHSDNTYHRMMYATTTDFRNFSSPQVWVDKGYSTIDSTVIEDDGTYFRYTKDERSGGSCGKFILSETSTSLTDTDWSFQRDCIGQGTIDQGEGPLVFKSNTEEKWYMFIDEYGGRGYLPFETTDLSGGQWSPSSNYSLPGRPRHGMILPLTAEQYQTLQNAL